MEHPAHRMSNQSLQHVFTGRLSLAARGQKPSLPALLLPCKCFVEPPFPEQVFQLSNPHKSRASIRRSALPSLWRRIRGCLALPSSVGISSHTAGLFLPFQCMSTSKTLGSKATRLPSLALLSHLCKLLLHHDKRFQGPQKETSVPLDSKLSVDWIGPARSGPMFPTFHGSR